MKHAYLILAHTDWTMLQVLLNCIDDVRNDIYIHFDKKVESIPSLSTTRSSLFLTKKRIDVRWGDISVVMAEYSLFEEAYKHGGYSYYHLLSGVDLPLHNQDYIHKFFDANSGKEFIGYTIRQIDRTLERKFQRWHLFPRHFRSPSLFFRVPRALFLRFQEVINIKRNKGIPFQKGPQWVSVTPQMVSLFLEKKTWVIKIFSHTFCCDEVVFQTLCYESCLKDNIYDGGSMRVIGWKGSRLDPWDMSDAHELQNSNALFARKFSSSSMEIVSLITCRINSEPSHD